MKSTQLDSTRGFKLIPYFYTKILHAEWADSISQKYACKFLFCIVFWNTTNLFDESLSPRRV